MVLGVVQIQEWTGNLECRAGPETSNTETQRKLLKNVLYVSFTLYVTVVTLPSLTKNKYIKFTWITNSRQYPFKYCNISLWVCMCVCVTLTEELD